MGKSGIVTGTLCSVVEDVEEVVELEVWVEADDDELTEELVVEPDVLLDDDSARPVVLTGELLLELLDDELVELLVELELVELSDTGSAVELSSEE